MFPDSSLSPLTTPDLAALATLALLLPPALLVQHLRERRHEAEGRPYTRPQKYRGTIVMLWLMAVAVIAVWFASGRPLAELGLRAPSTHFFIGGMALAIAASTALAAQVIIVQRNPKAQENVARQIEGDDRIMAFLPATKAELQTFRLLSFTAGVAEEIVFRGFMLWGFAHWMHPALAAALSLAIFTAAHLYQESLGALLRVAMIGLILTLFVMLSGSLWPAILVHIAVDLSSGEVTHLAIRRRQQRGVAC